MACSLRDALFAIEPPEAEPYSVDDALSRGIWPPLSSGPDISVRELVCRFAPLGAALRVVFSGGPNAWKQIDRAKIVVQVRDRIRDPGILRQEETAFCGPFSILIEFARRKPLHYVKALGELLDTGKWTTLTGRAIVADENLRAGPAGGIPEADWIFAATMRDDPVVREGVINDLSPPLTPLTPGLGEESLSIHMFADAMTDVSSGSAGGKDLQGLTTWHPMADWTHDVLKLKYHWETCFISGELDALLVAQKAIDAGGVAFLMIDKNLIKNGGNDHEEEMYFRKARHEAQKPVGAMEDEVHSKDDEWPWPNHWVTYLGGLTPGNPGDDDTVTLRLWSWGAEYQMKGTADSFGEYLYAVVTGVPWS
jgi:hypothetical protein